MKRAVCVLLLMTLFFTSSGCLKLDKKEKTEQKIIGVWFSYSELDSMLNSGNFKDEFKTAVNNCKDFGVSDVFIHIRPFGDSLYKSKYFPLRQSAESVDFDVLEFITEHCHTNGIRVHGWINPYRIRTADSDINALSDGSKVKEWLGDQNAYNDTNVCLLGGIYLNPASSESKRLIIDGIREIIENYSVDGIHFDDYFYPTDSEEFDKASYGAYLQSAKVPLSLSDWRRTNINAFVSNVSKILKSYDRQLIFSISPAASVEKNYQIYYADIENWIQNGYVDWIIPQLYFGFDYPDKNFCFDVLFSEWHQLSQKGNAQLIIGLAPYKIDTQSENEKEEWSSGNLLKREIDYAATAEGFCFFSYSSLFSHNKNNVKERENAAALINP